MPTSPESLGNLEIFSELNSDELYVISESMSSMKVTEGEVLARRGEAAHTFFVVHDGNFMVHFKDGRAFTLHRRGDVMGWSSVVTPFQYTGTMVALTDGFVLTIAGQELLRLIQVESSLGDKLMKKINPIVTQRRKYFQPD
jgi:CRP-like cAMP-binding protein